jgi:uncharacterized protein
VQAYNDALAEFRRSSQRFIPLAAIPFMSPIDTIVAEVERAVEARHLGINMLADPSVTVKSQKRLADPFWSPLWEACQQLGVAVHFPCIGGSCR